MGDFFGGLRGLLIVVVVAARGCEGVAPLKLLLRPRSVGTAPPLATAADGGGGGAAAAARAPEVVELL